MANDSRNKRRLKRHLRIRKDLSGTPDKPRLCVFRSNKNISAQIIDDISKVTLCSASTLDKDPKGESEVPRNYQFGSPGRRCEAGP